MLDLSHAARATMRAGAHFFRMNIRVIERRLAMTCHGVVAVTGTARRRASVSEYSLIYDHDSLSTRTVILFSKVITRI